MKRTLFQITAGLLLCSATSNAQWHLQHPSPSSYISKIQVFGNDTLYANSQNGDGLLLQSFDGGTTIDTFTFPNVSMLKQHFISGKEGFVVGYQNFSNGQSAFKTTDGGATWQNMNLALQGATYHYNIHFVNSNLGFVSGDQSLFRTSDGGATFIEQNLITDPHYISGIHFINDQIGFVSLVRTQTNGEIYRDMIFKTDDGGLTWTLVHSEATPGQLVFVYKGITAMQFVSAQMGFAVAEGVPSQLLKTTDGGQTWNVMSTSFLADHYGISDVFFVTEQIGFLATGNGIFKTVDGGQNWMYQSLHPQGDYVIGSLVMINENVGFASGHGIFKTTNGGGLNIAKMQHNDLGIQLYPNPSSNAIWIQQPETLKINTIQIIDATGKLTAINIDATQKINISSFAKGQYWLKLQTNMGTTSIPFIIQ